MVRGAGSRALDANAPDAGASETSADAPQSSDRLEGLYRDLAPAVLGYLRGSGAAEPEDLLGDVFVAVIRGLPIVPMTRPRCDAGCSPSRTTVWSTNAARPRRERATSRSPPSPNPPSTVATTSCSSRLSALPAVRALATLTPDQRAVVLLRDIADLSVADTAHVLGKKPGSVKTTHRRALAALARRVSGEAVR